jgi:hypothetical protein
MSFEDRLFSDPRIKEYHQFPYWMHTSKSSGRSREKSEKTSIKKTKIFWPYSISLEGFGNSYKVSVRDLSTGSTERGKLVSQNSGLERWEADEMFDLICEKARNEI